MVEALSDSLAKEELTRREVQERKRQASALVSTVLKEFERIVNRKSVRIDPEAIRQPGWYKSIPSDKQSWCLNVASILAELNQTLPYAGAILRAREASTPPIPWNRIADKVGKPVGICKVTHEWALFTFEERVDEEQQSGWRYSGLPLHWKDAPSMSGVL